MQASHDNNLLIEIGKIEIVVEHDPPLEMEPFQTCAFVAEIKCANVCVRVCACYGGGNMIGLPGL